MKATRWSVAVGQSTTTLAYDPAVKGNRDLLILAHGAGGHMDHATMTSLVTELTARECCVVRFNFLYREHGKSRPDPMPRLLTCWQAVIDSVKERLSPGRLFIGGRSMGGRAASMLAADGFDCDGLLLLAYPLHPAGKPDKLRDAHLPDIKQPVLCLNGTRDSLCDQSLMDKTLERVGPGWTMSWLDGADHGFHVLKRSGRTDADVVTEIGETVEDWLTSL